MCTRAITRLILALAVALVAVVASAAFDPELDEEPVEARADTAPAAPTPALAPLPLLLGASIADFPVPTIVLPVPIAAPACSAAPASCQRVPASAVVPAVKPKRPPPPHVEAGPKSLQEYLSAGATPKFIRIGPSGYHVRRSPSFSTRNTSNVDFRTKAGDEFPVVSIKSLYYGAAVQVRTKAGLRWIYVPKWRKDDFQFCESEGCFSALAQSLDFFFRGTGVTADQARACGVTVGPEALILPPGAAQAEREPDEAPVPPSRPAGLPGLQDRQKDAGQDPSKDLVLTEDSLQKALQLTKDSLAKKEDFGVSAKPVAPSPSQAPSAAGALPPRPQPSVQLSGGAGLTEPAEDVAKGLVITEDQIQKALEITKASLPSPRKPAPVSPPSRAASAASAPASPAKPAKPQGELQARRAASSQDSDSRHGPLQYKPDWEVKAGAKGAAWTRQAQDALDRYGFRLVNNRRVSDASAFCPNFSRLSDLDRREFWIHLLSAMSATESGHHDVPVRDRRGRWLGVPYDEIRRNNPPNATMDRGRWAHNNFSMGLLQMTYKYAEYDKYRPACSGFQYSRDLGKKVTDPTLTIYNTKNQIDCAVKMLDWHLGRYGSIGFKGRTNGWSSLRATNRRTHLTTIPAMYGFKPCWSRRGR